MHVHFPNASKKDGPSAGITVTACLVSLFTNWWIRQELAMTGEVTLHGDVLPVGGIKEKCIGALRSGIKTVILPIENKEDAEELPDDIKKQIKFHYVSKVEEVLALALEKEVDSYHLENSQKPIFKAKL